MSESGGTASRAGFQWSVPAPYRALFPLGVVFALAGAAPWLFHAFGRAAWPGPLHAALMIEGFELCFVAGFLLTAIPGFTHGPPCSPLELAGAIAGALAFGTSAAFGLEAAASAAFALTVLWLGVAAARRVMAATIAPAEEFQFVALGLVLGFAGGIAQLGAALRGWQEPAPRFGLHLISLGMVLGLVLGVGSLLVPVFAGIRDPLVIPGLAGPHDRRGRRGLYAALAATLALSFVVEARGSARLAGGMRALVATVLVWGVWKLVRLPGRRARGAWAMWGAGWLVVLGLWLAAVFPSHGVTFHHLVFIGGYGLLTLAIGTRVVVGHGRHPVTDEGRVLSGLVVSGVVVALALRVAHDWLPPAAQAGVLAASAASWIVAWLAWAVPAGVRIAVVRHGPGPDPPSRGRPGVVGSGVGPTSSPPAR